MGRGFFSGGSEFDMPLPAPFSSVRGCFEACVSFGVDGRVRVCGLSGFRNDWARGWFFVAVVCPCSGALVDRRRVFLTVASSASVYVADSPSCRVFATPSNTLSVNKVTLVGGLQVSAFCSWSNVGLQKSLCDMEIGLVSCVMKIRNGSFESQNSGSTLAG